VLGAVGLVLWDWCCGIGAVGLVLWDWCCGTGAVEPVLWDQYCRMSAVESISLNLEEMLVIYTQFNGGRRRGDIAK